MRLVAAADHAGRALKDTLVAHLRAQGHDVEDLGTHAGDSVDYPSFAHPLSLSVAEGRHDLGLLVCGTGTGMAIAANKVKGVRAANCTNELLARYARSHNAANVLCLGERIVGETLALAILDAFVSTPFEGGRHERRVDLIRDIEQS